MWADEDPATLLQRLCYIVMTVLKPRPAIYASARRTGWDACIVQFVVGPLPKPSQAESASGAHALLTHRARTGEGAHRSICRLSLRSLAGDSLHWERGGGGHAYVTSIRGRGIPKKADGTPEVA